MEEDVSSIQALILIVDDVPDNLKVIGSILMEKNYQIIPATNGNQAIQFAKTEQPDLILLDILMPEMDGFEVCRILKQDKTTKDIPIIFLTAKNESENIVKAFEIGGEDYITKPFEAKEMLARVHTHLNLKFTLQKLKELITTKDRLFSIITHDIKGPFSAMVRVSEKLSKLSQSEAKQLLSSKGKGLESDYDNLKDTILLLNQSIRNTYDLLENLLQWSSSQTGRLEYFPVRLGLKEITDSLLNTISSQAINKKINLINNVPEEIKVYADINILRTIIRNLVSNAIKYTKTDGIISINSLVKDNKVELSVVDTGVGIPEHILKDLFSMENKSITLGTENEHGTGLGLILCKEFANKMNSKIWVKSEEGKGSSFTFTLPMISA